MGSGGVGILLVLVFVLPLSSGYLYGGRNPFVISHRGYSAVYPENTVLSFEKAVEAGTDGIELDLHYTKDGVIAILHDDTLDRTTNCSGALADYTWDQLKSCDAAYHTEYKGQGVRVPSFAEVLEMWSQKTTNEFIVLDLKAGLIFGENLVDIVGKYGFEDRVIASCRTLDQVEDIRLHMPHTPRQFLWADYSHFHPEDPDFYKEWIHNNITGFSVRHNYITHEFVQKCHSRLLSVFMWVTDDPIMIVEHIAHGDDAIMTNNPKILHETIKEFLKFCP